MTRFKKFNQHDAYILGCLNVNPIPIQQHPIHLITWSKPLLGRVKLNTDGSCLGNPGMSGAGGVIRDMQGSVLLVFSMNLGYGDGTKAELRVLLEGIKRCKELNLSALDIEVDSQVVLSWLQKNRCRIWYLEDYWEEIQELIKDMDYKLSTYLGKGMLLRIGLLGGGQEWVMRNGEIRRILLLCCEV
ncbi:ribonuclease H-like [Juglans regia]|uniref:Ribonuclease H-like n=1 Tax=Juglans regia TaxID=51240 RepID=A0A6P9EFT6_JUGRE|nr:ribonuclease H-like [Juglans regia]